LPASVVNSVDLNFIRLQYYVLVSSETIKVDESGESLEQGNENDEICR